MLKTLTPGLKKGCFKRVFSFKDGKAFCAIINRYRPDLLDYEKISKASSAEALNKAFDVAEESLEIPKMLDVDGTISLSVLLVFRHGKFCET